MAPAFSAISPAIALFGKEIEDSIPGRLSAAVAWVDSSSFPGGLRVFGHYCRSSVFWQEPCSFGSSAPLMSLDGLHLCKASLLFDFQELLPGAFGQLVGEGFEEVGAGSGVFDVHQYGLQAE